MVSQMILSSYNASILLGNSLVQIGDDGLLSQNNGCTRFLHVNHRLNIARDLSQDFWGRLTTSRIRRQWNVLGTLNTSSRGGKKSLDKEAILHERWTLHRSTGWRSDFNLSKVQVGLILRHCWANVYLSIFASPTLVYFLPLLSPFACLLSVFAGPVPAFAGPMLAQAKLADDWPLT